MRWVWCSFDFEGWHHWAGAEGEVEYLKHNHRHLFKGKVWVEVNHNDRDIEFITLKHQCLEVINELDRGHLGSCEMTAEYLIGRLTEMYPKRKIRCEISEDGENGCIIDENDTKV